MGQASQYLSLLMISGEKRRLRVRLWSSFGHLQFLAKSTGRRSGFVVASVTDDFGPKLQAAGQASE